jgi:electron transport complex protein RnfB
VRLCGDKDLEIGGLMSTVKAQLTDAIDALLPQTECTKCGYQGCRPYAEAIARGDADINQSLGGAEESAWRSCGRSQMGSTPPTGRSRVRR